MTQRLALSMNDNGRQPKQAFYCSQSFCKMTTGTVLLALLLIVPAAWAAGPLDQLRVEGHRLFVKIEINGIETEALLDSGAEMTLIDSGFAEHLSLVTTGRETARGTGAGTREVGFVEDVTIEVAGVVLEDRMVAVLDLGDISRRLIGEQLNVVVGRELFDSGRFRLDIDAGRFTKVDDLNEPPGVRLPLIENKGIKQMPITIEGLAPVYADFDLGNGSEVLLAADYALANGLLDPGRIVDSRSGGGIGGAIERDIVELETIGIAGQRFHGVLAAIDPTENSSAANVGVSLLRNFIMTIDFSENSLWLVPIDSGSQK